MVKGFPPIYTDDSRILILGSMPSEISRRANAYYANKRNRFWQTIFNCINMPLPDSYGDRINALKENGIALWDIAESCEIDGSKDSTIRNTVFNDIEKLINQTKIEIIFLNGKKAYSLYEQKYEGLPVKYSVLPSTSPANVSFNEKIWLEKITPYLKK